MGRYIDYCIAWSCGEQNNVIKNNAVFVGDSTAISERMTKRNQMINIMEIGETDEETYP